MKAKHLLHIKNFGHVAHKLHFSKVDRIWRSGSKCEINLKGEIQILEARLSDGKKIIFGGFQKEIHKNITVKQLSCHTSLLCKFSHLPRNNVRTQNTEYQHQGPHLDIFIQNLPLL
jgi:hypothetical protein